MQNLTRFSPPQLYFIFQFSTKIDYLPGKDNVVADSISRTESIRLATDISLIDLARAQEANGELRHLLSSPKCSLNLKKIQWGSEHTAVVCDLSGDTLRPYISALLRKRFFDLFHSQAHPGLKTTDRLIRKRYIWPNLFRNVKSWCKTCITCQSSKVS